MSARLISKLGDSILRRRAFEVIDPTAPAVQQLIDDMVRTCALADGVGLAGPQVATPLRIFILESKPGGWYPDAPVIEPMVIINPQFLTMSESTELDKESCLSIPGVWAKVRRHKLVVASFTDQLGERKTMTFEGLAARVFQHEHDHLDGILFIDRVDRKDLVIKPEYEERYKDLLGSRA